DANGIVNVSATDKGTGKEQHITITSSTNMSKDDIDKAVREAEAFAAEDAKRREAIDTRNQAEQLVYQSEKTLGEIGDKVSETDKQPVNDAIAKLKETLKGDNTEAIKADTEALSKAFYALSEKLYAQNGGAQGTPGADAGQAGGDGQTYYDADYSVDEDQK
ncbi:MAG: Hsp70 family protein, partial [Clostridia bacterium]|nr:Hsp70 family protein [Clostridia bacterium]